MDDTTLYLYILKDPYNGLYVKNSPMGCQWFEYTNNPLSAKKFQKINLEVVTLRISIEGSSV